MDIANILIFTKTVSSAIVVSSAVDNWSNPLTIEVIDEEIVKPVLDTDGDNLISKNEYIAYYERGGWRDAHKGLPYYHNPMFDWEKSERWINDPTAVKYWLEFKGGNPTTLQKYRKKN